MPGQGWLLLFSLTPALSQWEREDALPLFALALALVLVLDLLVRSLGRSRATTSRTVAGSAVSPGDLRPEGLPVIMLHSRRC